MLFVTKFILHLYYLLHLYTFKNNKNKICVKDNVSYQKKQAEQRDGKLIKAKKGMLKTLKT